MPKNSESRLSPEIRTLDPLPAQPLVSVVVPSFNQGRYIRTTIDSILQQSYRPLEIEVVDGGSRDETVEVLRSYGDIPELRWTSEPDRGVAVLDLELMNQRGEVVQKGQNRLMVLRRPESSGRN